MIQLKQDVNEMPETMSDVALVALQLQGIPTDKVERMKEYAQKLRRKFPKMKPDRIKRKVAEEFHINLI